MVAMRLAIGALHSLQESSRFTIHLSTGLVLVLFKLSHLRDKRTDAAGSLTNSDGTHDYFCMNQECPHAGGPMEDSELKYDMEDDTWIASCPWHSYDFNVKTGDSSFGMKTCTYPVMIQNGTVFIDYDVPQGASASDILVLQVLPVSEMFKLSSMVEALPDQVEPDNTKVRPNTTTHLSFLKEGASITSWCTYILNTPNPSHKIELTHHFYNLLDKSPDMPVGASIPPSTPPRTALKTIASSKMPKLGRAGTLKSRIAILHSLANIEQWAIDLALDICARFSSFRTSTGVPLPRQFFVDWIKVANDEAKHFSLLRERLESLGSYFGELPVHHGLWDSAEITAHDLRARISIIALVHEARGLDVNPATIKKFEVGGDQESVESQRIIHNDEVTHVTTGHRWLCWICGEEGTDPVVVFRENVKKYFMGAVKGPFNVKDRQEAGLDAGYYLNLEGRPKNVLVAGG